MQPRNQTEPVIGKVRVELSPFRWAGPHGQTLYGPGLSYTAFVNATSGSTHTYMHNATDIAVCPTDTTHKFTLMRSLTKRTKHCPHASSARVWLPHKNQVAHHTSTTPIPTKQTDVACASSITVHRVLGTALHQHTKQCGCKGQYKGHHGYDTSRQDLCTRWCCPDTP